MNFSNDPHDLPNTVIAGKTPLLNLCVREGFHDYHSLARYVMNLSYRRNSRLDTLSLVLAEKCGSCSTKHSLLASVALELALEVELRIGIYEMDGANTPGVGEMLKDHSFNSVPEAHCYLASGEIRIDLTRNVHGRSIDLEIIYEESVSPEQVGEYKNRLRTSNR